MIPSIREIDNEAFFACAFLLESPGALARRLIRQHVSSQAVWHWCSLCRRDRRRTHTDRATFLLSVAQ